MTYYNIPKISDGRGRYLHFNAGIRAAKTSDDKWVLEPLMQEGQPMRRGFYTLKDLSAFANYNNLQALGFQDIAWTNGEYDSFWSPIISGKPDLSRGPSNLWSDIFKNLRRPRLREEFEGQKKPSHAKTEEILDNLTQEERLSASISLSLRNVDTHIEQISEIYYSALVNRMRKGKINFEKSTDALDQSLFAHVNAFYLHLGSARDYLATLIAHRCGMDPDKIDSMARLTEKIRLSSTPSDAILSLFRSRGLFRTSISNPNRLEADGNLSSLSALRNEFVHKRPYGSKFSERFGWVIPMNAGGGTYRYFRPLSVDGICSGDVFDFIGSQYIFFNEIFFSAAENSGYDHSMMTIAARELRSAD